ncbi:MAG: precorrin-4 C(11)-methyltransferase [Methanobacterium sp.]|uniref:precorrin-4 C(11)-methyltransferase n=1 Tax=Methanobacterium sp. TaxID=2164 RepID=UPI003D65B0AC|nr:precorrin-4 C(11)-methyltransferase [Methanobacterium sp.]
MEGKVIFIGAGPGDPELLTIKGKNALEISEIIIYAGSLVNKEILSYAKENTEIYNSASMNLDEILSIMEKETSNGKIIARVHTGDPSIYGAIGEQIQFLRDKNIHFEIIPGVSSLFATAAALESELTLPEVSQTVIITRPEGRTPKPQLEAISNLAEHNATMCIFLGVHMIKEVVGDLLSHYSPDTPVAVVKKASWHDEMIIKGTLENIADKVREAKIEKTAMIVVGKVLDPGNITPSKLYDSKFTHEYRKAI